jgi:hypothetical protein
MFFSAFAVGTFVFFAYQATKPRKQQKDDESSFTYDEIIRRHDAILAPVHFSKKQSVVDNPIVKMNHKNAKFIATKDFFKENPRALENYRRLQIMKHSQNPNGYWLGKKYGKIADRGLHLQEGRFYDFLDNESIIENPAPAFTVVEMMTMS